MRRQSRVSSHASLLEHKSEAASNERATRSRTSSEDLVILELPKCIRTKRTSHLRSGVEGHEPIKNGKGSPMITPSVEGEVSRRGLRSTEHAVPNNKDVGVSEDHHGGGDAKIPGRTRRRSGRVTGIPEESEKAPTPQLDIQKESRSLRRRTRSGTMIDHVGNGPSGKPKDNDSDHLQADHHDIEALGTQKTKPRTEDSNKVDDKKGITETLPNEHQPELEDFPKSTSVQIEPDHLGTSGSGETEIHIETASIASSGRRVYPSDLTSSKRRC